MARLNRIDLEHVLRQILMAEQGQAPLSPHLAFGLREVLGTDNNTVPGQGAFGAADRLFPHLGVQVLQNADSMPIDFFGPGTGGGGPATSYAQTSGFVFDSDPRTISNLISDQTANNPAALAAQAASTPGTGYLYQHSTLVANPNYNPALPESLSNLQFLPNNVAFPSPADASGNLFVANVTPDAGLSAPFNSWLTFFGQFFDHGLDLVTKGGNGTVFIPLLPDDPLYVPGGASNFMVLTRATQFDGPGADGILGTADDTHHETQNTTTPFVDQNQTYSSHPSHQVFLRDYAVGSDGFLHSTGRLLTGADGHSMATWADVKANALKLGITLTDADVGNVPLLATDDYGNFIRGANGFAQVVMTTAGVDGIFGTGDDGTTLVEGTATGLDLAHAVRTGHAFLNDIAHDAAPVFFGANGADGIPASGDENGADGVANTADDLNAAAYNGALLNVHYIAGDGRVNENIGLTAVHDIFHSEHNRQIQLVKDMILAELANGDTAFATDWVLPGANVTDGIQDNEWNGERLFQVAKFATETQYQHIVFEEFARKIAPTIHLFGNNDINLDPAITAEFAHAVYRFGHSMLDENVNRYELQGAFLDANGVPTDVDTGVVNPLGGTPMLDANGDPVLNEIGLIQAFLNPLEFAARGANATAEIILGSVNQMGNEIDEFVTGALRNNLLGLPLDLAALNIARGRDTGVPPLNLLRAQLFASTQDTVLKPYDSWTEFGQFLKHAESLVNFIAAYGTHSTITSATTLADKRLAAQALVDNSVVGSATFSQDAFDFTHSLGIYANNKADIRAIHDSNGVAPVWSTGSVTGVDTIDLWIGGLAEKQNLFGGLLGSTFNFIFETQMEALQDADRLYYLPRIEGLQWGTQIENNSFAELIMLNTGARHLSASIFLTPEYVVEASNYFQRNPDGTFASAGPGADGVLGTADDPRIATDPSTWLHNALTGAPLVEVLPDGTVHFLGDDNFFGNTMVLGGTNWDDRLIAGQADDDTVWGDGGNDFIDGGNGNDFLYGGDGNDIIRDESGDDVIHGDAGNDDIDGGTGDDIIFGNDGNDLIHGGNSILGDELQGGEGNDILFGDEGDDALIGNEGDDWISGGDGGDGLVGDVGAPTGQVPLYAGNDVLDGGAQGDKMMGFSGDDIMLGLGGFDKFNGLLGFDWASFEQETHGVSVDMERREFVPAQTVPAGDAVRDFFVETEAVSGSAYGDVLKGTIDVPGAAAGVFNELTNVDLIFGLSNFFAPGPVSFSNGNIMLGGDGSDMIEGRAGNDIIDGDAWLHVGLTRDANGNIFAGSEITRDIFYDLTPGDVDTAVYNDVAANYIISALPDAQGFYTVSQVTVTPGLRLTSDGTDLIRNIERLQFSDQTISIDPNPGANRVPTGTLVLSPDADPTTAIIDAVVGTTLTVTSTVDDPDGIDPLSIRFQWQDQQITAGGGIAWVDITGATGTTFTPTNAQLGNALRVVEYYTDVLGMQEQVMSAPTNLLAPNVTVNTPPFIVQQQNPPGLPDTSARTGTPINLFLPITLTFGDNETAAAALVYTASLGSGAALSTAGLSFIVQGAPGAVTGAFLISDSNNDGIADPFAGPLGPLSIRVTATDNGPGTPLSITDTFIINVQKGNTAPVANPVAPISVDEGGTATGVVSGFDPDGTPVAFRLVIGSAFGGTVTAFDPVTGAFTFVASADEFLGSTTTAGFNFTVFDGQLNSAPGFVPFVVNATDDGVADFAITGTAAVGQFLTALIGVDPDGPWDPDTASYQWFRDGVAIGGPVVGSADYLVTADDVGHSLSAQAVYTDAQGFVETVDSAAIDPIGLLSVRALAGVTTATVTVSNTLSDPDGNLGPDASETIWEVSATGALDSFVAAPPGEVSADGQSLTQVNNLNGAAGFVSRYVRVTTNYVDAAGNFNTATSDPVRVFTGNGAGNTMTGGAEVDIFFGLGGADTISTGGGDDTLVGGAGGDNLNGGAGNDTFLYRIGDGADTVSGGAGSDLLAITGTGGNNTLDVTFNGARITNFEGGTVNAAVESITADLLGGTDTLTYTAPGGVTVNLATGVASGFTSIAGIENVSGNGGADNITGDGGANVLNGNGNNDTLNGGAGNDTLNGGAGADILIGGDGADAINTGAGNDNVADIIRFSATSEFGDTVTNFDATGTAAQIDRVEFGGALNTAFDDIANDDNFVFVSGNGAGGAVAANMDTTFEAMMLTGANGEGVTTANLGNATAVSNAFNAEFNITAADGQDAVLVVNDTNNNSFAVWQWIQAGGGETSAAELTLIGIFTANATVTTGGFDFI